jgi:predicted transcriptional regulator
MNESIKNEARKLEAQNGNISIRSIKPYNSSNSRPFTTIVVDKKHSLAMEIKDDSKSKVEEAIGQAIYSTSKRTVEDSIFKFDIVLQLFQFEDESIKRWLDDALKIVEDNKHGMNLVSLFQIISKLWKLNLSANFIFRFLELNELLSWFDMNFQSDR